MAQIDFVPPDVMTAKIIKFGPMKTVNLARRYAKENAIDSNPPLFCETAALIVDVSQGRVKNRTHQPKEKKNPIYFADTLIKRFRTPSAKLSSPISHSKYF